MKGMIYTTEMIDSGVMILMEMNQKQPLFMDR